MNSGIYIITNTESQKCYIGSTVGFKHRWTQHRCDLRKDQHHNPHLQSAWNKYGESAFEFIICECVEDEESLHIREQYWLDYHRMLTEVYNYGVVARSPMLGCAFTEEHKCKIGNSNRGRKHTKEQNQNHKDIMQGNKCRAVSYPAFINQDTGETITKGHNLAAICREMNLSTSAMYNVKNGRRAQHKGWVLLEEQERLNES